MDYRSFDSSRMGVVLAAALVLGGCSRFKIASPTPGAYINPVQATIDWSADLQPNTFKVVVDPAGANLDVTNVFGATTGPSHTAAGTLPLLPIGQHTLKVDGNLYEWFSQSYTPRSSSVAFSVHARHK
jgi:hypothetical protein